MNDRFKFRVWHIESSTMIYPDRIDFWKNAVGVYWEDRVLKTTVDNKTQFILFHADDVIVMQSTGLKDSNGKLIYEGDVVNFNKFYTTFWHPTESDYEEVNLSGVICAGKFGFDIDIIKTNRKSKGKFPLSDFCDGEFDSECWSILGNIYENKGLLDGK